MSLGRGLGALISTTSSTKKSTPKENTPTSSTDEVLHVPLSSIFPDEEQPRRYFSEIELQELAASITHHGILQPLLVSPRAEGGYELIAGERRWRAAGLAGLATAPVIVREFPPEQKLEVSLIENIQRQDLNPIEEAKAFERLITDFGLTQQEVADKVGKSRPAVANTVRLLNLPEEVQTALIHRTINMGQARALLAIDNQEALLDMFASMQGKKITVRELEKKTSALQPHTLSRPDPNLTYLEDELRAVLGTKVSVNKKNKGGTITIHYFSPEELGSLVKKIIE